MRIKGGPEIGCKLFGVEGVRVQICALDRENPMKTGSDGFDVEGSDIEIFGAEELHNLFSLIRIGLVCVKIQDELLFYGGIHIVVLEEHSRHLFEGKIAAKNESRAHDCMHQHASASQGANCCRAPDGCSGG